jgi:hypothetical protein
MTLQPFCSHFRKETCHAISLGRYGLRHNFCGHNWKWAFIESWHCSSRGATWWSSYLYNINNFIT